MWKLSMKLQLFFSLLIFAPVFANSQNVYSVSPSAKVLGLGGAATSIDGDISTIYCNPAGLSHLKGLDMYYANYSTKLFNQKLDNNFFGFAYSFNKKWSFGLTFQEGKNNPFYLNTTNTFFTIKGSYKLKRNFSIGMNLNLSNKNSSKKISKESFDIGILKKIPIRKTETFTDYLNLGFSVKNVNPIQLLMYSFKPSQSSNRYGEIYLINNLGISYQFEIDKKIIYKNLKTFTGIILLDSRFYLSEEKETSNFYCGTELNFMEIITQRFGYSNQENVNYFSYGAGIHLPFSKLFNVPIDLNLDYGISTLTIPNNIVNSNLNNFSLRLNWFINQNNQ